MTPFVGSRSLRTGMFAVSAGTLLALTCARPLSVQAVECTPKLLPQKALGLVKPLMKVRAQQAKELEKGGHWDPESPLSRKVDELLTVVLRDGTPAGDQAVAYLLTVYMGEHYGEDIACEVLSRGRRMLAVVRAVNECQPLTGLEPFPPSVLHESSARMASILEDLESGKTCDE